jgi:hypothetical protein
MADSNGQPNPGALDWLRRFFEGLRSFTKIELRIITVWGIPIALVVGVLLGLTAADTGKPGDALDILTGSGSPIQDRAGAAGVALAIIGYLLVPAFIGALVAAILGARVDRLLHDQKDVEEDFKKELVRQTYDEVLARLEQEGIVQSDASEESDER